MSVIQKDATKVWTCPKCKRQFRKTGQGHSCAYYPLERHLAGKSEEAVALYNSFIERLRQLVGDFYIESLPCCIHLVNNAYTFAGVYVLRDKIRLHTMLSLPADSPRLDKIYKASSGRYPCSIDIRSEEELDNQLFGWMRQAYLLSLK